MLSVVMLNVKMLSAIMLNVMMLSDVMLNVLMLNVVAPICLTSCCCCKKDTCNTSQDMVVILWVSVKLGKDQKNRFFLF